MGIDPTQEASDDAKIYQNFIIGVDYEEMINDIPHTFIHVDFLQDEEYLKFRDNCL
jgi:hypothetical protein